MGSGALALRADLKAGLRRAERRQTIRALALVAPLLIFLALNFIAPIALMMLRSVQNPELPAAMPQTAAAMRQWDSRALPHDGIAAVFADELKAAQANGTLGVVASRLNYDINGFRSLLFSTARNLPLPSGVPALQGLIEIDPRWGDRAYWSAMQQAAVPITSFYLLASVDRRIDADGELKRTASEHAVFVDIFLRTFWISFVVTALCLALGYPVAYLLASLPSRVGNLLIILVLLPFWTPVLVRTTAWVVLLQREGMVNDFLQWLLIVTDPLALIYNRTGVYIAMTHVLLPFMVLPLYGVMKGIPKTGMIAALSLGARPIVAFRRVYLPQSRPGINAGCLLVFILSIGFYITPLLVGGPSDQMVSYFIAFYTNQTLNWGMASALGLVLLAVTLILFALYNRIAGGAPAPKWS
jgi:putative spermidine/putrescine transport system permease protein